MKNLYRNLITSLILATPALTLAATGTGPNVTLPDPFKNATIPIVIDKVFSAILTIASAVVPIFILVGAFQMITSGGNPEKFKTGRQTIVYAALGFLVVLMAKGIVSIITSLLVP